MPIVELVAKKTLELNPDIGLEIVDLIVLLWMYSNPYDNNRRQLSSMRNILKMSETLQIPGGGLDVTEEETAIFGKSARTVLPCFEIDSTFQGQEALEKVERSLEMDRPYAVAFVDVRMPPGWDGVETIRRIRRKEARVPRLSRPLRRKRWYVQAHAPKSS